MKTTHTHRLQLSEQSLLGLAVGDAFGEKFFLPPGQLETYLTNRWIPSAPWDFTDDTVMAMGVYASLQQYGEINQDALAQTFADNYQKDDRRGYGGTAHSILRQIGAGSDWQIVSSSVFDGMGSMGNGAAMRAGLIGAYFYDDLPKAAEQARLSAEVTHSHPEGQAGAIAIGIAAALACQASLFQVQLSPQEFIEKVCEYIPEGETLSRSRRGIHLSPNTNIQTIVEVLGNGSDITVQQTVPFTLWVTAHHLYNYEEAIWTTVNGLGDRDTTCAIVGSIVSLSAGKQAIPELWIQATESIYDSIFLHFL
ncbi:ADP-ribosylglycohydrolase family protein [Xanthocytophaga flava]|uniref:ADP-ribosylglycohydrolase family protein n=1 Tax=Xanthocytophaga flava TaxID=3048013 RepID=UPI0028D4688E|nr:ADP-ribosylglycohydrolase family protein [Xanthocytophaga flavus]MDJ1468302.1 ADP-ribosylglycohydrolase family protein [Xanthocytophaga flavus]